ncbi:LysR substrate-binding domain-containing protein [Achromobacter xylosoxidans]|uniref:LysR substrate-binding domain-containing protein n=1 Tax=Alcaligenes xylosoxydans xylosoxydans TaxID=85698 RepID=UPI001F13AFC8|nr:LysR substrate-binding domain-containing protein [Achromobacter xylosoxidans]
MSSHRYLRSRLKTRHLLLLTALADEGNVHRAAQALAMTQPAASKMLRELEQMLAVQLFERLPRGVQPTEYGKALIRHARLVIESLDQAHDELAGLKEGQAGHVRVGAITSPAVRLLPGVIATLKREAPMLDVTVEVESSNVLLERLAQDRLDLVIGRLSEEHDKLSLNYEPLTFEPVNAVVRPGHPLLRQPSLTLDLLEPATWIVPPLGSVLRHRFELMFQRASVRPPTRVVETSAPLFITRLLECSDMLAVLAADVAQYYAGHGMVVILPLPVPCQMDDYGIITRNDRLPSPAAAKLYTALKAAGAPHAETTAS